MPMRILVLGLITLLCAPTAWGFDRLDCMGRLSEAFVTIPSPRHAGKEEIILGPDRTGVVLPESESKVLNVKDLKTGKTILKISPWAGIDAFEKNKSYPIKWETDESSWFRVSFTPPGKKNSQGISCRLTF
ncbi:MAG: hypothetical protein KF802_00250 [Bdellovibrionaceae bacterium]|nr:hypothetical protein [Pseudobdellovibrionaceae bacterium]